jgi:phosphatidylserine/phosphatidylglycerophosphate/cardiolipin synthase-like enzyme
MSMGDAADRADRYVGDAIERAERGHHRRRLSRIGWANALDAAPGFEAPNGCTSAGNRLELLIDGADALPRIAAEIRRARRRVFLAGWFFSAGFALVREPARVTLVELLAETAERGVDVYLLAWAGAPVPLFRPARRAVDEELRLLAVHPRIHVAADRHERPMHCHHEKVVVIDDLRAFVGGIDLTDLAGDRYDAPGHPWRPELGWHDATALIEGPAVADVASHFHLRWSEVTGEHLPVAAAPGPAGSLELQVLRTVPEHVYGSLHDGAFTILQAYAGALRRARRFIYLENQFLWSSEIVGILAGKLRNPPSPEFRLLTLLPARPNTGGEDTRGQLGVLLEADDGAGRVLACTRYAVRPDGPPERVYVHAKMAVVDDEWFTVGSANLNEHSLFNDSEMNVAVADPVVAAGCRRRLWAEHLGVEVGDGDPCALIHDLWRPVADEQARRLAAGEPLTCGVATLPEVSSRSRRLLGPVQSLLVDG